MTTNDRWQITGSAAEKYERFVASWFQAWAVDLIGRADVQPGHDVLDVACGTGVVTRALAPVIGAAGSIVASDLNEDMLAEAQRHAISEVEVTWRQADATELPFEAGAFDAVLCQQGLQFVPDKQAAVAEMWRVLRPGGVAAVSVWCSAEENPYIAALASGLTRHVSPEAGQTMLAPCGFGDPDVFRQLFVEAGFSEVGVEMVTIVREPTDAVEAISGNLAALPIAAAVEAMTTAAHAAMIDDILVELAPHIVDGRLEAPSRSNVAIACWRP